MTKKIILSCIFLILIITAAIIILNKKTAFNIVSVKTESIFGYGIMENDINCYIGKESVIRFSDDGELFVINRGKRSVKQYDKHLNFKRDIGRIGQGPGEYLLPVDICIDKNKNIYIADLAQKRLIIYDSSGCCLNMFSLFAGYNDIRIAVNSKGLIYVNSPYNERLISVYNKEGKELTHFGKMIWSDRNMARSDLNHIAMTFDENDNLWVALKSKPNIRKYSPDGKLLLDTTLLSPRIENTKRYEKPIPATGRYSISNYLTDLTFTSRNNLVIANHDYLIVYDTENNKTKNILK